MFHTIADSYSLHSNEVIIEDTSLFVVRDLFSNIYF